FRRRPCKQGCQKCRAGEARLILRELGEKCVPASAPLLWTGPPRTLDLPQALRSNLMPKPFSWNTPYPKNSKKDLEVAFEQKPYAATLLPQLLQVAIYLELKGRLETIVNPGGIFRHRCLLLVDVRMILCQIK